MRNKAPAEVSGVRLRLRLIEPDDAGYIYGLRTNPNYNAYLSPVTGTADDQRRWIEAYKAREAGGTELYYVIERLDGTRCGVVRLYDISEKSFTWGSWILDENKPAKAALESAILIYDVGFGALGLAQAVFDVRRNNLRTLNFHERFGATRTHSDQQDIFFTYPRETFLRDRERHIAVLTGAAA